MNAAERDMIVSRLPQTPQESASRKLKPAAVLIPIITRAAPAVLFTLRTEHLPAHAGQVSFPGGRRHEEDRSLTETALREVEEETGIGRTLVTVAGFLDPYETVTGFQVLPVVGFVEEGFSLRPCADEVADIFEVPLAFLLEPANRQMRRIERNGAMRDTYIFDYGRHRIWGATASMLVKFAERVAP